MQDFMKIFFLRTFITGPKAKYDIVTPKMISHKTRTLRSHIVKPSYWNTGVPERSPSCIEIKTEKQINALRETCGLASKILNSLNHHIKVGVTTEEIDDIVYELCMENGAYPSPLNYQHYPKSICTSVNNVACHGIPDSRKLRDGDIINIDITVYKDYMHGDCSAMFCIGDVDDEGQALCTATKEAMLAGVSVCKPGIPFSRIGKTIEDFAAEKGFSVIPSFLGHGIGSYFHGLPDIYHFDTTDTEYDTGEVMLPGMAFTIEPILSEGSPEITVLKDGWTAITTDSSRTAQWEHTVLITENGVDILTSP